MRIEGYNIIKNLEGRLSGVSESQMNSIVNRGAINIEAYRDDNVDISNKAIEFNKIKSVVKDIPDIRKEKIQGLQDTVRSGKYDVKAELVEPKLVREHIMDALLLSPYIP